MASKSGNPHQRQFPRLAFHGPAEIIFGRETDQSETLELSEGGFLMATALPLAVGDQISAFLSVEDLVLRARGEVIYILDPTEAEARRRYGVRFLSLLEEYRAVIRTLSR